MDISFVSTKLRKIFNSEKELNREYGTEQARTIMRRMATLKAAASLDDVPRLPPDRRHELTGDLQGHFAVDLKHPCRLLFLPNNDPLPKKADGGIDLQKVTTITITKVKDYH